MKVAEKKDEFVEVMEQLLQHQTTINALIKCYQEKDFVRLQEIVRDLVQKYDKTGYGQKATFLFDIGQKVLAPETKELFKNQAKTWQEKGMEFFSFLFMP